MKKTYYIFILIYLAIFSSCEKESTVSDNSSFVSLVQTDINYFTRNCFQLSDGSYIICGSNIPVSNNSYGNFGLNNAIVAKFSPEGDLIWKKQLPGTLYDLKKGIPLSAGGFVLAGYDSTAFNAGTTNISSRNLSVVIYSNDGVPLKSTVYLQGPFTASGFIPHLDFVQLKNGNFAFALNNIAGFNYSYPRLMIFDSDLNIVADKNYTTLSAPNKNYFNPKLIEGNDGSIYFTGRRSNNSLNPSRQYTYLLKINNSSFDLDYNKEFVGVDSTRIPGGFVFDKGGNICITTARQVNSADYFYTQNEEKFSIGNSVSVLRTDTGGNYINTFEYDGFPQLGTLTKIIHTSDGGFLMVGTCNKKVDFSISSSTQIMLIKTDSDFNQQWMKRINTTYPSIGFDVFQTSDGGYVIGGFQSSFNKNYKMMLIKTDSNGD